MTFTCTLYKRYSSTQSMYSTSLSQLSFAPTSMDWNFVFLYIYMPVPCSPRDLMNRIKVTESCFALSSIESTVRGHHRWETSAYKHQIFWHFHVGLPSLQKCEKFVNSKIPHDITCNSSPERLSHYFQAHSVSELFFTWVGNLSKT